jgi:predicted DsbA family dithiol-disulfide isomerase
VPTLEVQVWSDIACPWCYVGKRRLEAAIARMPSPNEVEVVWRAFELDPAAPRVQAADVSYAERLARKYRASVPQAQAMIDRMTGVAAGEGLAFRFDRIRPGNTFDAHRVVRLALERGVQGEVQERLFRAYFTEGAPIGEPEALVQLAADAGLDAGDVRAMLETDAYSAEVRADEEKAQEYGIHAVPFFVLGGEYGVSGAQPADVLHGALMQAWNEAPQASAARSS